MPSARRGPRQVLRRIWGCCSGWWTACSDTVQIGGLCRLESHELSILPTWLRQRYSEVWCVVATLKISSSDAGVLGELREFMGERPGVAVDLLSLPAQPGAQGSVSDVLSVAVGTGGAVTVAIRAIRDWVTSMHTKVHIELDGRKFTLETRDVEKALPQVEQLLKTMLADAHDDAET